MNARNLSKLSKTFIFFLPIFIVVCFIIGAFYQLKLEKDIKEKIVQTDSYIDYISRVFEDDDLLEKENISALKMLLGNELRYTNLYFDSFWLYKLFLVTPDGTVLDIEKEAAEIANSEEYGDLSRPVEYVLENGEQGKEYSLYIVELNSFIYKTVNGEEIRQFPKSVVDEANGERLSNVSVASLLNISTINHNDIEEHKQSVKDYAASYSYMKISFTLNAAFYCSLPPSWSNWWPSNVSCSSISVVPA